MERLKKHLKTWIFPKLWVILLSVPLATILLLYVFAYGYESSPIAYPIYAFSAYSLTIFCAAILRHVPQVKKSLSALVDRQPFLRRYAADPAFRVRISLYLSFCLNTLYAVWKFSYGFYTRSVWFGTMAVYYFLLAVMRLALLRHLTQNEVGEKRRSEWKWYLFCGVALLLMNLALAAVVVLVVYQNHGFTYAGYLIYVMAMYAFYNIISAIRDVIKYRKNHSPVIAAAKIIRFVSALVSMLSLETAMLTQFNNNPDPEHFRQIMTACTGGGVCILIFATALYMIVHGAKNLTRPEQEETV